MTPEEAVARESIRQTITNYTIGGDSQDGELFNAQWADDAKFEFAGYGPHAPAFSIQGIAEITARTSKRPKLPIPGHHSATFTRHNLTTCHITLTGKDTAKARTYFVVFTDIGPDHAGVYTDDLVKKGDRWVFAHRRITLDWRHENSCFPPVKK